MMKEKKTRGIFVEMEGIASSKFPSLCMIYIPNRPVSYYPVRNSAL